jgi:hypothetical protein
MEQENFANGFVFLTTAFYNLFSSRNRTTFIFVDSNNTLQVGVIGLRFIIFDDSIVLRDFF